MSQSETSSPSGEEIVELLNRILSEAIDLEASDVHLSREDSLHIRFGRWETHESQVWDFPVRLSHLLSVG